MYNRLGNKGILPPEQKGGRGGCRGTKDQLMIVKMILRNCRRRLTNLAVAWIDYTKAYDMVPHSWIIRMNGVVSCSQQCKENVREMHGLLESGIDICRRNTGESENQKGDFSGRQIITIAVCLDIDPFVNGFE